MNNKDKSLDVKGHQVKPVILELSQQQQNKNQSLIKKMIKQNNNSNLKFAGGYKNNNGTGSQIKKQLYRPQQQQSKYTVRVNPYQQLGVSKLQSKYRISDQNSVINNSNVGYSMQQLQSKVQLLKKDRDERNNHLLKVDEYKITDNKQRFQNVVHAQSSLDVINLENIQAKLQAHRRNMKSIQDQYNLKKGKQSSIDRYGYMKVNIDVDKEHAQLQIDEGKIYELVKKRQNLQPEQVQFEDLWEMKKKNDPKLAEYDAKYQQYLVSKDAKNLLGSVVRKNLFTWDRFTQPNHIHKSKALHKVSHSPSKQHNRSISKQKITNNQEILTLSLGKYGPDGLASIKDIKDVIAQKDDKFIAAYIFTQIDSGKVGMVSKQQLHDYLLSQEHIINGYNIDTKWLFTDLDNFQTKRKGMLNKPQLAIFLAILQKIDHPKLMLTNKSNLSSISFVNTNTIKTQNKGINSTFNKFRPIFQKLFNTLDFNDDKIIKRAEYIENIYIDSDCVKILDQQVIKIQHIGKSIKIRQIIGFILDDYQRQKNQKLKKSKQYITFTRFCQYFQIPESLDLSKIDKATAKKKQDKSTQFDVYDMPEYCLLLLKDVFNQIPRVYQDYIVSADFVQATLRDPQILAMTDQLCRIASIQTGLPLQSLGTTLHRMQKQCDQYSTWETIKLYFSRRGRPLDWDYELIKQKRQLRNKKLKQQRQNVSKSKLRETQNYFKYQDDIKNKSKEKINRLPDKYTVPQPFDITDMKQKTNIENAKQGQKQFEELKKQFKALPVNKEILQPKPELIEGKVKKQKSLTKKPVYDYENYENDRIQRALKRAQQQYDKKMRIQQIKQKTQIKAMDIGIDLTKKYQDVIKQQQKKKRQTSKYKPTKPKVSENLYPADLAQEQRKKLEKLKQKMKKQDQALQRRKNNLEEQAKKARMKNEKIKKTAQDAKQTQQQKQKNRTKITTEDLDFKPKINKKQLSIEQKQKLEKQRQERQKKKQQQLLKALQRKEEQTKRRLGYDKKSIFIPIQGLTDDQILDKIDQINFEDLLLEEKDKQQYKKEYDNQNKTLKQLKERQFGLAGRQRAAMEQQEKRIMQEKKRYKQKLQKQKTNPKQNYSKESGKGEKAVYQNDLNFHKSKALRRYRALMDNKVPDSQFDKYSVRADIEPKKTNKKILQDQQISQIQPNDNDEAQSRNQQQQEQQEK